MNFEIVEEKENKMLDRKEFLGKLVYDEETPSREALKHKIADMKKVKTDVVAIRNIGTIFGTKEADVVFFIYDSKESKEKFEPAKLQKKKKEEKYMAKQLDAQKKADEEKKAAEEAKPAESEEASE